MTPSSSEAAFQYGGIYGDFYRYNYTFSAPSTGYTYPIQISSKGQHRYVINIQDQIIISGATYPQITYVY